MEKHFRCMASFVPFTSANVYTVYRRHSHLIALLRVTNSLHRKQEVSEGAFVLENRAGFLHGKPGCDRLQGKVVKISGSNGRGNGSGGGSSSRSNGSSSNGVIVVVVVVVVVVAVVVLMVEVVVVEIVVVRAYTSFIISQNEQYLIIHLTCISRRCYKI